MFDFIFEIGSSLPWIYRGWLLALSSNYRGTMRQIWRSKSLMYKVLDIGVSFLFVAIEIVLAYVIVN
jgi:hypothetical protein